MDEFGAPLATDEVLRQEFDAIHGTPEGGWKSDGESTSAQVETGLREVYRQVHMLSEPRMALCLSGGGIRSATYCLGALQALASSPAQPQGDPPIANPTAGAEVKASDSPSQLERIHYLSTVSGGGYIGGFLTTLLQRNEFDYAKVAKQLCSSVDFHASGPAVNCIRWLRRYSNYLAPQRGWSADTWSMIAIFLRNLLLNWVVIVPAIMLVLLLPLLHLVMLGQAIDQNRILVVEGLISFLFTIAYPLSIRHKGINQGGWLISHGLMMIVATAVCFFSLVTLIKTPGIGKDVLRDIAMLAAGGVLFVYWLTSVFIALFAETWERFGWCRSANILRERLARGGGTALAIALIWVALHALVFYLPPLIMTLGAGGLGMLGVGGAAGIIAVVTGFREKFSHLQKQSWFARAGVMGLNLAAGIFIVVVLGAGGAMLNMAILKDTGSINQVEEQVASAPVTNGTEEKQDGANEEADRDSRQDYERALVRISPVQDKWKSILDIAQLDSNSPVEPEFKIHEPESRLISLKALQRYMDDRISRTVNSALDEVCDPDDSLCLYGRKLRIVASDYTHDLSRINDHVVLISILLLAIIFFGAWFVGVNRFSLGNFYENRLVRGYLGASNEKHAADQYSGFDERDDVELRKCMPAKKGTARLFPIIGIALNLVRGSRLEWQQRKASSFSMSPLHCGAAFSGYRKTEIYGGENGVKLGRAMAISGAAVSPNMGYHSSPLITFLLTFFNARLGWWLPNPSKTGEDVLDRAEPSPLTRPIFDELLGRTTGERKFVYLSDGGHFDNLGLYEMVRRRCAVILAIDATSDPDSGYEDLASTIRKIRVDLGISIDLPLDAQTGRPSSSPFCVAPIDYPEVDGTAARVGYLIYVKPTVDDSVPIDVWRYAKSHSRKSDRFPHQPTADQFFSEDQFESYRMLGFHNLMQVLQDTGGFGDKKLQSLMSGQASASRPGSGIGAVPQDADTSISNPGNGLLPRAVDALQSGASLASLATAVTIGGVVGVAGSVALQPGGTVSLAPGQTVMLKQEQPVIADWKPPPPVQLDVIGALGLKLDQTASLDLDQKLSLAPGQEVRLVGADGGIPIIRVDGGPMLRVLIDGNKAFAASLDRLHAEMAGIRANTEGIRNGVDDVRAHTENLAYGRNAIDGRGGGR